MLRLACLVAAFGCSLALQNNCEDFTGCNSEGEKCPQFTVLSQSSKYQVREYPASWWTSTSDCKDSGFGAFRRLFSYIQGGNDKGQKIPMTAPVLMRDFGREGSCDKTTMSFWTPENMQSNPPQPTGEGVSNEQITIKVAVRCFEAQPMFLDWGQKKLKAAERMHLALLKTAASSAGLSVDGAFVARAGYNSPWQTQHREVMLPLN